MSSLPEIRAVRKAIESVEHEPYKRFLQTVYLCGAARAVEITGERCSGEKDLVYGPKGTDCWLTETSPPNPTWLQVLEMLLAIQTGEKSVKDAMAEAKKKIPIVVFKIKVAKQHLEVGEEPPFRLVALPFEEKYEPWSKPLYEYFQKAGEDYVFPFNRSKVWYYLTFKQPVFEGMHYRIKKYNYMRTGEVTFKVFSHMRKLKIHGLRHIRVDEVTKIYDFDGMDLGAYVGWSLRSAQQGAPIPSMVSVYADIRENWQRYIRKLCKERL
jgi:hypothetical protein